LWTPWVSVMWSGDAARRWESAYRALATDYAALGVAHKTSAPRDLAR
jgi:hypothetical protein